MNPLDTDQQFQFTLANPNPKSRKGKDGPIYRVEFELTQDEWQSFMDTETKGMVIECIGQVTHRNTGPIPKPKPVPKPFGDYARRLKQSGFFRAPAVWDAIGTDQECQDWVRHQPCCICGEYNETKQNGERVSVVAYVLRADLPPAREGPNPNKPKFSYVPMTDYFHQMQHNEGELKVYILYLANHLKESAFPSNREVFVQEAKDWFRTKSIEYVERWAWEKFKQIHNADSMGNIPPETICVWAASNNVTQYLPSAGDSTHG